MEQDALQTGTLAHHIAYVLPHYRCGVLPHNVSHPLIKYMKTEVKRCQLKANNILSQKIKEAFYFDRYIDGSNK